MIFTKYTSPVLQGMPVNCCKIMATRRDLDPRSGGPGGIKDWIYIIIEEDKAGSGGAYGCVFRVTVNGRHCIAKKLHNILPKSNPLDRRRGF